MIAEKCEEVVLKYFKVLFQLLPLLTEKYQENIY